MLSKSSALIEQLMEETVREMKPLTIYEENFNPSRRLFEGLGFMIIEENGFQLLFHWDPSTNSTGGSLASGGEDNV